MNELNPRSSDDKVVERLFLRFSIIYGEKWKNRHTSPEEWTMAREEWASVVKDIGLFVIKDVLDHCRTNLVWPPSIAEFLQLCDKFSGLPDEQTAYIKAIRRNFDHPITLIAYLEIGNWEFTHAKETELKQKFKPAYEKAKQLFRESPEQCFKDLKDYIDDKTKALPPPSTPFSNPEGLTFRQMLKRYEDKAKEDMAKAPKIEHPIWDQDKIKIGHPGFDYVVFDDRRKYLTGLSEELAMTLSNDDKYDRIRFLREQIGEQKRSAYQEEAKFKETQEAEQERRQGRKAYNEPWPRRNVQKYKSWMD